MKPKKINRPMTEKLRALSREHGIAAMPGYTLYATDTVRGRCSYRNKTVTVPVWTFHHDSKRKPQTEYVIYYLAHECAHSHAFEKDSARNHGPAFMRRFIELCPQHLQHFELNYKPRAANAAGITPQHSTPTNRTTTMTIHKYMLSRFNSNCTQCLQMITRGERITHTGKGCAYCTDCKPWPDGAIAGDTSETLNTPATPWHGVPRPEIPAAPVAPIDAWTAALNWTPEDAQVRPAPKLPPQFVGASDTALARMAANDAAKLADAQRLQDALQARADAEAKAQADAEATARAIAHEQQRATVQSINTQAADIGRARLAAKNEQRARNVETVNGRASLAVTTTGELLIVAINSISRMTADDLSELRRIIAQNAENAGSNERREMWMALGMLTA